ncbi:MAG: hypothetical protein AAB777_00105 [Patescibacteria group bacterium]
MNAVLTPSFCKPGRPALPVKTLPAEIKFGHGAVVSGELLMTRFALPCLWGRFEALQISEGKWMRLLAIALGKSEPEHIIRGLLSGLFPRLVVGLYEHRGPNKDGNPWSYQNVLAYLSEHKGHADECAAKYAVIYNYEGAQASPITGDIREMFLAFSGEEEQYLLFDLYQIRPEYSSVVLAHKSVIIAEITTI